MRDLVPESQAYMDLLNFEKKLDSTITRKKLEIQEALKRPMKVKRRLRIYVSHTFYAGKEPEVSKLEYGHRWAGLAFAHSRRVLLWEGQNSAR